MSGIEMHVVDERETLARREDGAEELAKIANELRALHRAEQNAGFEMGRLLCKVAGTTWLRVNLPLREDRADIALWAKREVRLTYVQTARLMDVWHVREALSPGINEPSTIAQFDPLRPFLKHGKRGRDLINEIWEQASKESDRKDGPSRSHVAKVAKRLAPDIVGKKQPPKSRSKQKALAAITHLADKYEKSALIAALNEYLKEMS